MSYLIAIIIILFILILLGLSPKGNITIRDKPKGNRPLFPPSAQPPKGPKK